MNGLNQKNIMKSISVVIPNFNDFRIERTIRSIVNQTSDDYEIIVVEGCVNNTNTKPIYEQYQSKISFLIHEPDKGIFDALNKGIKNANGDLIFLIGSDDYIPSVLTFEKVIDKYSKNKNIDGICLNAKIVDRSGKVIRNWSPRSVKSSKMKWGILPHHFSLFLSTKLYKEIGFFKISDSDIAVDTEWLLKLAKHKNLNIIRMKDFDIHMQQGGLSTISYKNAIIAIWKTMLSAKKLGYPNFFIIPFVKVISKIFQIRF